MSYKARAIDEIGSHFEFITAQPGWSIVHPLQKEDGSWGIANTPIVGWAIGIQDSEGQRLRCNATPVTLEGVWSLDAAFVLSPTGVVQSLGGDQWGNADDWLKYQVRSIPSKKKKVSS